MYRRVAPKNWKFCDSGQIMGKVIIKWFYLYYFWFNQPYALAMPKNQNQKIRCAHAQIFYGAQSIRNAAENPRTGFLQSPDRGMNKNKKTNIFSNSTSLKLSFALCHGSLLPSFPEIAIFWATLICTVIMQGSWLAKSCIKLCTVNPCWKWKVDSTQKFELFRVSRPWKI